VVAVSSSATPAAAPPRCRRARSPPSHTHLPDPNPNHTSFVTAVVGAPLRWEKKVGGGWRAVRRRGRVSLPTARLVDAILLECPSGAVEKHRALPCVCRLCKNSLGGGSGKCACWDVVPQTAWESLPTLGQRCVLAGGCTCTLPRHHCHLHCTVTRVLTVTRVCEPHNAT
jgi:hypothetical protein